MVKKNFTNIGVPQEIGAEKLHHCTNTSGETGKKPSLIDKIKLVYTTICQGSKWRADNLVYDNYIFAEAGRQGLTKDEIKNVIEILKRDGYVMEPKERWYRVVKDIGGDT